MVWVRIGSLSAGIWEPLGNVMHLIAPVKKYPCAGFMFFVLIECLSYLCWMSSALNMYACGLVGSCAFAELSGLLLRNLN